MQMFRVTHEFHLMRSLRVSYVKDTCKEWIHIVPAKNGYTWIHIVHVAVPCMYQIQLAHELYPIRTQHVSYTQDASKEERWGAGVETQKNVRGEIG